MSNFAPLHIISCYTFLQSGLTIEKIAASVAKQNYFGMGITDKEVLYGAHEFCDGAEKIKKPYVIGCEIKINNDNISLFVKSEEGYRNLLKILYHIQKEDFDLKILKTYSKDLIAVIETKYGDFRKNFLEMDKDLEFAHYLIQIADSFNEDFYLGIEATSREDISYANEVRKFTEKFPYKCVAFPRIRYAKKDDAIVIDIVSAIADDQKLDIKKKDGFEYFMDEKDYAKIYTKSELQNTIEIVKCSTFNLKEKRGTLLKYSENSFDELKENCYSALDKYNVNDQEHIQRLDYELGIINQMGYCNYFLLVQDYVKYAKENEILVGPGRGSAAGSLVSYLLNITEIDPLKYNLQFERFLNPARKTMPDIDVDFMDIRRDDMVQYMRNKYGQNRVANIVTFQRIMARKSLRDIASVYGYPDNHITFLIKALPKDNENKEITLREAYKKVERFRKIVDSDPYFLEIVSLASKIEGLPRQDGMHAAGVVINEDPLENSLPVTIDPFGNYIAQYEMNYLEEEGFLKMDFLSLRNLTVLDLCVKLVNQKYPDANLNPYTLPYDEEGIFDLIRDRQTMGIFQLESAGMKRAIKILKPNCFDDIVALLALFRPGPMDSIKLYASRKEGKSKPNYISPALEEILAPTYGIIVYQEQINKIAQVMAGFSPAEADVFRRAISKKVKEKILAAEKQFIAGSMKNGYSEKVSHQVFNHILKFANYGFNKSHSVVYSIIACRLTYLKLHYPLEFYSSILQVGSSVKDPKFNEYISEMKRRNFTIYPPNINQSTLLFTVKEDGLLFPLSSIHGVNVAMSSNVITERKIRPFSDFYDFILRMYEYKISEKEISAYINSGALDCLCSSRASMRLSLKGGLQFAQLNYREDGQLSMGIMESLKPKMSMIDDDPIENLNLEYNTIGIMLSDNPIKYKKASLDDKNVISITDIDVGETVSIAGLIKSKKTISTKKGESMAFIKVFDETSEIEITIFPRTYSECFSFLETNKFVLITGKVEGDDEDELSILADSVTLLED